MLPQLGEVFSDDFRRNTTNQESNVKKLCGVYYFAVLLVCSLDSGVEFLFSFVFVC